MAETDGHFEVLTQPDIVICKSKSKTGDLMLVPATMEVDKKETPGSLIVGRFGW